ncbi:MAG: NADH-quinone oxidoreductase subunit J [Actinobacteria bacterium]|nr:NADH-quinone oxidoreductase subunit J [Actinomycetota bacterium]MBU1493428.1 NADH-quinone oxidoreductase subunit J [Actinomycetota bacterium]
MVETVLFVVFAITALGGAISMVWARNPVYSALGLMLTMFSLAVFYVSNAGHFVAVVQVIVYAGAVMTLFLFVIMLIGVDKDEDRSEDIPFQRPLTLILLGLFAGGVLVAGARAWTTGTVSPTEPVNGTIEAIGESLFGDWVLPFEVTALLLIIAAAGTIALAFFGGDDEEGGS